MITLKKTLLAGLATLSLGLALAPAQAQTAEGRHSHAARLEKMQSARASHFAERTAKLHTALKLTAAQEPAWNTFVAAITPAPHTGTAPDHAAIAAMSAPERMEKHLAMAKARLAGMETRQAALKTFYATLSAEQKKTFDDNAIHAGHGRHAMMARMHSKQ
jgi:protein CpxP